MIYNKILYKDNLTLYARDANEQVMAIYERDTIIHEFEDVEYSAYKTTLKISSVKNGCEYDLDLGGVLKNAVFTQKVVILQK